MTHLIYEAHAERGQGAGTGERLDRVARVSVPMGKSLACCPGGCAACGLPSGPPEVRHGEMRVGSLEKALDRPRILPPGSVKKPAVGRIEKIIEIEDRTQLDVLE